MSTMASTPQRKTKQSLANLLEQPLPVAVDAARHRFMKGPVKDVTQGEGQILVHLDPSSTAAVLIPPTYLGWPVRMVEARTAEPAGLLRPDRVPAGPS